MNAQVCGWWMLLLPVFLFFITFAREENWKGALQGYISLSIPIVQVLSFLADPPNLGFLFFVVWLVYIVLPTSRNYIAYKKWRRIPMYNDVRKEGFWSKDIPQPIGLIIGGVLLIEGTWILRWRLGLAILWIWSTLHITALLNRKFKPLAVITLNYLPIVSSISLIFQCPSWPAFTYAGSLLVAWAWIMKQDMNSDVK
ncbi:MAG: hypothetical protein PWQ95_1967 [Thermococcaceae archaeon]|nr:hypothetical protein [Thermococcaceae archaeon]